MGHCEWSFKNFGVDATSWLCTRQHWDHWLGRFLVQQRNAWKAVWEHNRFVGKLVYRAVFPDSKFELANCKGSVVFWRRLIVVDDGCC